ncbi:hypothetical protein PIB30_080542, partial [Stylosanthes scabra]|nr:hypothetical protein [Stylosanthes scabra]
MAKRLKNQMLDCVEERLEPRSNGGASSPGNLNLKGSGLFDRKLILNSCLNETNELK